MDYKINFKSLDKNLYDCYEIYYNKNKYFKRYYKIVIFLLILLIVLIYLKKDTKYFTYKYLYSLY